jgi:electron transport complex protein RnfB
MDEIYDKLRQHFSEGSANYPKKQEILQVLELLFKPGEVEYALALPLNSQGRLSLEEVAGKMQKAPEVVEEMLETMAREAKVMVNRSRKDGKKYYSLWTLTIGIMENTFAGTDDELKRKLAPPWKKYYEEVFFNAWGASRYPLLRIVPINDHVDSTSRVLPFEEIRTLIEKAEVIAVISCFCREIMKKCNHKMDAEIVLGAYADYMIHYRGARSLTREEALQVLEECEKDGLVHLTGNVQEGSVVICNCCPCCCGALRAVIELDNRNKVERSNFEPTVKQDECTMCLQCQEVCPTKAITGAMHRNAAESQVRILVDASRCIGCGLCASHCPTEAIVMVKVRDVLPARTIKESVERYEQEKIL